MKKIFFILGSLFISIGFFTSAYAADPGNATSTAPLVTFHIRYQDKLLFEGPWPLEDKGDIQIQDKAGQLRLASSTSVLALLTDIDSAIDTFDISDLAYYPEFSSFIVNCVHITQIHKNACSNWLYAVNNITPFVGMDKYILRPSDDVWIYFGATHQVVLSKSNILAGETFTVNAQNYEYTSNTWTPLLNVTVGIITPNSYPAIEIATSTVDSQGQATFTLAIPGSYQIGIAQDYYFPAISFTVATPTPPVSPPTGGGFSEPLHHSVDIQKAIQFLVNNQKADGSFASSALYTDWAAIGLASFTNAARDNLKNYLLLDPSPGTLTTDYERRAMALEALGINPYSGTKTNYIKKIIDTFDGKQFGNSDLVNDDIFALFPLLHAGIPIDDPMVKRAVSFILSTQQPDGSWIGGVDMTSAMIQGLFPLSSLDGVSLASKKANDYLRNRQGDNGGFDNNVSSSSWALQAIISLGQRETDWQKGGNTVGDYLFWNQAQDGGLPLTGDLNARIWETSYAIVALLKKPWNDILMDFPKPLASQTTGTIEQGIIAQPILATSTPMFISSHRETNLFIEPPQKLDVSTAQLPSTVLVYSTPAASQEHEKNIAHTVAPASTPVDSIKTDNPLHNGLLPQKKNVPQAKKPFLALAPPSNFQGMTKNIVMAALGLLGAGILYLAWKFIQALI